MSTRRRHRRIKITSRQASGVVAALLIMVIAGRAMSGHAASWLDVVLMGVAAAVLVLLVVGPRRRRRAPVRGRSILSAEVRQQRRTDNQVLGGGHTAWAPPASAQRAVVASRTPAAAPRTLSKQQVRLAVAEELLEAHGLTADYRHMVSAVEQDAEADRAG